MNHQLYERIAELEGQVKVLQSLAPQGVKFCKPCKGSGVVFVCLDINTYVTREQCESCRGTGRGV